MFKVGDIVRIKDVDSVGERLKNQIGKIVKISFHNTCYVVRMYNIRGELVFLENELILLNTDIINIF